MIRDERIALAQTAHLATSRRSEPSGGKAIAAALDAALADIGGLDGLAHRLGLNTDPEAYYPTSDFDALRADRDRLREALREITDPDRTNQDSDAPTIAARALRVSGDSSTEGEGTA